MPNFCARPNLFENAECLEYLVFRKTRIPPRQPLVPWGAIGCTRDTTIRFTVPVVMTISLSTQTIFVETIEIQPAYRGKAVGAQVCAGDDCTFAASCGLMACKPFALQYANWMDEGGEESDREQPGFEAKKLADFRKVTQFWSHCDFGKCQNQNSIRSHLSWLTSHYWSEQYEIRAM